MVDELDIKSDINTEAAFYLAEKLHTNAVNFVNEKLSEYPDLFVADIVMSAYLTGMFGTLKLIADKTKNKKTEKGINTVINDLMQLINNYFGGNLTEYKLKQNKNH